MKRSLDLARIRFPLHMKRFASVFRPDSPDPDHPDRAATFLVLNELERRQKVFGVHDLATVKSPTRVRYQRCECGCYRLRGLRVSCSERSDRICLVARPLREDRRASIRHLTYP